MHRFWVGEATWERWRLESLAEALLHINLLDLRAIQVFMDNTTAMWYCNKQGEVGLWTLCQEALRLWT